MCGEGKSGAKGLRAPRRRAGALYLGSQLLADSCIVVPVAQEEGEDAETSCQGDTWMVFLPHRPVLGVGKEEPLSKPPV